MRRLAFLFALTLSTLLLVPAAIAGDGTYTYDMRSLPFTAWVVPATLRLNRATVVVPDSTTVAGHISIWLGVSTYTAGGRTVSLQAGIDVDQSGAPAVYVEGITAAGWDLRRLAPYTLGTPLVVRLSKTRAGWWVRVLGQTFGPVRISVPYIEVGGESYETPGTPNSYDGSVVVPPLPSFAGLRFQPRRR